MRAVHRKEKKTSKRISRIWTRSRAQSVCMTDGPANSKLAREDPPNHETQNCTRAQPRHPRCPCRDVVSSVITIASPLRPDRPSPEPERQRSTGLKPHPAP
jgi:hypothetical protein